MGLLSFLSALFSKISTFARKPGWIAARADSFRLHRFPTDEENGDEEGRIVSPRWRWYPIIRVIILILGIVTAAVVFVKLVDLSRFPRPKISYTYTALPMWASSADAETIPVLGESTFDYGMYFPAQGNNFFPLVASYNEPPRHRPKTPLFIPFTRNNAMMRQTVLGYIASGWPREDIVIVDNSGTVDANNLKMLSHDNPFFLDYDLFRYRYGVSILQTSVLLNFAQLQNYLMRMAMAHHWPYFFWSHMDVGILSHEEETPYMSFYQRVLKILDEAESSRISGKSKWAVKFFNFDYLTLVNVDAWRHIGQWDVFIPYYATDCDAYGRLKMLGYAIDRVNAGHIWDVANYVEDPEARFFPPSSQARSDAKDKPAENISDDDDHAPNSKRFKALREELQKFQDAKNGDSRGRNTWQNMQKGGKGEPWTYDPAGFQIAWWEMAEDGRKLYKHKWGSGGCDLFEDKKTLDDLWKDAQEATG
ncbi:hypothetical protein TARUN_1699 [Trichoderma arundinaceum]|uniref:Uncharacterized protein n=1 Tax=Trichoderma arundinaceum TaxID=490622 RepID=A0A395NWQ1_TRIAR|nr:hypothetical protein TARUN_1699 [Trichoderma arundinaceum]